MNNTVYIRSHNQEVPGDTVGAAGAELISLNGKKGSKVVAYLAEISKHHDPLGVLQVDHDIEDVWAWAASKGYKAAIYDP